MIKRKILARVLVLLTALMMILPGADIFADGHSLESIDISVEINDDGSAKIVEVREANLIEGTENYIIINNLGDSDILDFKVRENGIQYEEMDYWDIDLSREEKTYKSGVVDTFEGYELCWGIGEYGRHTYELEYTVTNFIKQFQDRQGIYWRFINDQTNIPPQSARVTIRSNDEFWDTNSKIWAFGYEGEVVFDGGQIVATSSSPFESFHYLTILVELEDGMFSTGSQLIDRPFEEIKNMAFEGSDYNLDYYPDSGGDYYPDNDWDYDLDYNNGSFFSSFWLIGGIMGVFLPIVFLFIFIFLVIKALSGGSGIRKSRFKGEYYRDYPYDGPFEDAYYILHKMGITNRETLITGFILKWIYQGYLVSEKVEAGFLFKKEESALKFVKRYADSTTIEGQLYDMMMAAAGSNWILESNEFSRWAQKNYRKIDKWDEDAKEISKDKLVSLGYLDLEEAKFLFTKYFKGVSTLKGQELEGRVHKFMNYLKDFSLLNEHESINVGIWDNLMIWAGVLGITEAVAKEFKKLYPNYETESVYRTNGILMAHSFSRSVSHGTESSGSSGGGGFSSSGGGGGGSFGGGSGGGTR